MRLRWVGHDPNSGLPWPDKWVPDVDADGNVANLPLMAEAQRIEEEKYGAAISGKRGTAGRHTTSEDPKAVPPVIAGRKRKWDRVLRGCGDTQATLGHAFKLRGGTSGIRDSDSDEEGCSETDRDTALRDIRRRRMSHGTGKRRRKMVVVEDEDGEDSEEEDGVVRLT